MKVALTSLWALRPALEPILEEFVRRSNDNVLKNDVQTNSTYKFGGKINQICILEPSKYFIKRRL